MFINEEIKKAESKAKLEELGDRFYSLSEFELVTNERTLLKEGGNVYAYICRNTDDKYHIYLSISRPFSPLFSFPTTNHTNHKELKKICRKAHKPRMFFMFNDGLLYAEIMAGQRFIFRKFLPIATLKVKEIESGGNLFLKII